MQSRLKAMQKTLKAYPQAKLIVVSKNRSLNEINQAIQAGITDIAENRVQEAAEKLPLIPSYITKHLIGHLQKNKVKKAVQLFDIIQSVDSLELAEKINAECAKINKIMPILLQVNISRDPNKFGFLPDKLEIMSKKIIQLSQLEIRGLMCIPKYEKNAENTRKHFHNLKLLYKKFIQKNSFKNPPFSELSMGMSSDYQIALEEGSTIIRVGTFIFEG